MYVHTYIGIKTMNSHMWNYVLHKKYETAENMSYILVSFKRSHLLLQLLLCTLSAFS